jgi:hypothetical protein
MTTQLLSKFGVRYNNILTMVFGSDILNDNRDFFFNINTQTGKYTETEKFVITQEFADNMIHSIADKVYINWNVYYNSYSYSYYDTPKIKTELSDYVILEYILKIFGSHGNITQDSFELLCNTCYLPFMTICIDNKLLPNIECMNIFLNRFDSQQKSTLNNSIKIWEYYEEILKLLISYGAPCDNESIKLVCKYANENIIRLVLNTINELKLTDDNFIDAIGNSQLANINFFFDFNYTIIDVTKIKYSKFKTYFNYHWPKDKLKNLNINKAFKEFNTDVISFCTECRIKIPKSIESKLNMTIKHLKDACRQKSLVDIKNLITKHKLKPNIECLQLACKYGTVKIIEYIISLGIIPDQTCMQHYMEAKVDDYYVRTLFKQYAKKYDKEYIPDKEDDEEENEADKEEDNDKEEEDDDKEEDNNKEEEDDDKEEDKADKNIKVNEKKIETVDDCELKEKIVKTILKQTKIKKPVKKILKKPVDDLVVEDLVEEELVEEPVKNKKKEKVKIVKDKKIKVLKKANK